MYKLFAVLQREFLLKVRTRGFLIGTLLIPLLMMGVSVLPAVFMSMNVEEPTSMAVIDRSGQVFPALREALADTTETGERLYDLIEERAAGRSDEELARVLGEQVAEGLVGGFIIIPEDALEGGRPAFYAENVSDFQRNEKLERALVAAVREVRIRESNLDSEVVAGILKPVRLSTFKLGAGGEARRDEGLTFGVAYVVGFVFYVSLLIYGAMMLRTTLEEKTSRSAESMVATVRPIQLMGGKIIGIGVVGLTQLGIWAAIAILMVSQGGSLLADVRFAPDFSQIGIGIGSVVLFLLFFILGFFFYAALFGAVGAMVNSESDAQQLQFPVTIPIIIALLLMFLAIRGPDATIVRICSLLPFFAPILMPVRITVLTPPAWEIVASCVVLLLSIAGAVWVSARIFRVGILMYGKRPTLPELIKWIRYG